MSDKPFSLYFKCTSAQIQTDRDQSLLRLVLSMAGGEKVAVDFHGEGITAFQKQLNTAIQAVPGLAAWGAAKPKG